MAWTVWCAPALAQTVSEVDAVGLAVQASPSVRAARFDRSAAEAAVRAARDARVATFTASGTGAHSESLGATPTSITRSSQDQVSLSSGLTLLTDLGTQVDVTLSSSVSWRTANLNPSSATLYTLGPNYATTLQLELRQPLLRGAGDDSTLGELRQAEASRDSSARDAEQAASELLRDVLVAHRELVYAQESRDVSARAVELAEQQARDAEARGTLGTVARTEVLRYQTELATARSSLRTAEATLETAALALGELLGVTPSAARALRAHVDDAPFDTSGRSVDELLEDAVARSPQLLALEADVAAARERVRALADADQVRLDLTATLAMGLLYNSTTIESLTLPDSRPAFSATGGVELELPVGGSQQRAARQQAEAQLEATQARYEASRVSLESDVATAHATLASARERLVLALHARDVAHELAEAERGALSLGTVTAVELVEAQQSERSAALEALRAEADVREAEARLTHLAGGLLDRFGVRVEGGAP